MAKKKTRGEGKSTYFRKLYQEHPDWLGTKSNELAFSQYRTDNNLPPEAEIPQDIKVALSNAKMMERSITQNKTKKAAKKAAAASPTAAKSSAPVAKVLKNLDTLEESIDECITAARSIDREGLHSLIIHLLKARREVIWKMGQ